MQLGSWGRRYIWSVGMGANLRKGCPAAAEWRETKATKEAAELANKGGDALRGRNLGNKGPPPETHPQLQQLN